VNTKGTLLLLLLSISLCLKAQNTNYVSDSAMSVKYNNAFIKSNPTSPDIYKAYFNLMTRYCLSKDSGNLKKTCLELLYGKFSREQRENLMYKGSVFYQAAIHLAEIYEHEHKYETALKYVYISDTVYPYHTTCGNDFFMHQIITGFHYAAIYEMLNDRKSAERALLKIALNTEAGRPPLDKLKPYLLRHDKSELKKEIKSAILAINTDTVRYQSDPKQYYYQDYLVFLDTRIPFWAYSAKGNTPGELRKAKINFLKQSNFYKMVMEL